MYCTFAIRVLYTRAIPTLQILGTSREKISQWKEHTFATALFGVHDGFPAFATANCIVTLFGTAPEDSGEPLLHELSAS